MDEIRRVAWTSGATESSSGFAGTQHIVSLEILAIGSEGGGIYIYGRCRVAR